MYQKASIYKRISLVMGITTLLLGLIPVPVLGQVGMVSADDGGVVEPQAEAPLPEVPPADAPVVEEPVLVEPLVEESPLVDPLAEEPLLEEPALVDPLVEEPVLEDPALVGPLAEEPLLEEPALDQPVVEEPPVGDALFEDSSNLMGALSLQLFSAAIGDDPAVSGELPGFGNTYSNGDCVTNPACVTDEPVTNPNDYTDQGTYGEKDYSLPDFGGNEANIVAVKRGNDWFFFKVGSGEACDQTTFCVEFDGAGNVKVFSYEPQANGYLGYNMIHFWYVAPPDEGIPGCIDRTANNFNPNATEDDGSCEYDIPGCTDQAANNFDPEATEDDGSCEYDVPGCIDQAANNFDPEATEDDGSCEYDVPGCMDQAANNYNPDATEDNGSCEYDEEDPLGLTISAVCTPGQGGYFLAWSVNNPNGFAVDATWDLNGSNGAGSLAPGSNFIGNSPTGSGSYTLNVSWGSGQASKSAQALCAPEITDNPPDDTTTLTITAPQTPLVIPVTGADLDGEFPMYRRLMLLAGSVLLTSGMFIKGTTKKEKKQKI